MSTGNLPRLRECLIELHLPAFREHYAAQAALATQESLSYPRFLLSLSEIEVAERHERKIQRQRRASKLPWEKTLTALDRSRLPQSVDRQLTALLEGRFWIVPRTSWLSVTLERENPSGLCSGPGVDSAGAPGSVFYLRPAGTAIAAGQNRSDSGEGAQETGSLRALIVDDIGYVQQSREEMEVLFTLLAHRYERRSILLTSNLIFSDWERIFKDPLTTAAAIDRLVHHSVILELNVPSYRMESAKAKQQGTTK